jgi:peroxiredoxin
MTAAMLGLLMSITAAYEPAVGQRHPDFTLSTIEGDKTISLSDLRGQKVLLIHFASW